jgi:hypothetical protein
LHVNGVPACKRVARQDSAGRRWILYPQNRRTPARMDERAAQKVNHASTCTTQLYDRHTEEVTLDEVERILD